MMDKYKDDLKFQEFLRVHKRNSFEEWNLDSILNVGKEFETQKKVESENEAETGSSEDDSAEKVALKETISDLDYLRALTVPSGDETQTEKKDKDSKKSETKKEKTKKEPKNETYFDVKLSNLPFKTKKKDVKIFLKPLKPQSIRVPQKVNCTASISPFNQVLLAYCPPPTNLLFKSCHNTVGI